MTTAKPVAKAQPGHAAAGEARQKPADILRDIFRQEALQNETLAFGSPVKQVGVSTTLITAFLLTVLVGTITFLGNARYARKETVTGQVTAKEGAFNISAQLTGTASQVFVAEGQRVKAGQELLAVAVDPVMGNGASLIASLKALQADQRQAHAAASDARLEQLTRQAEELSARKNGIDADIERLQGAQALYQQRESLQLQNLDAFRRLAQQGMISEAALRQHQDNLLGVQQQMQQGARETALQHSQRAQVQAQIRRLAAEADAVKSETQSQKAQLDERDLDVESRHGSRLIAPISGTVTALQIRAGAPVAAGQTLAVIIPDSGGENGTQLEVELWAPSKAVGFVRPGAQVRMMYDAFPYQTFGVGLGRVRDISGTPMSPSELSMASESREHLYRIRVSLLDANLMAYGRPWPLVPGMRLSADLILEEQSLLDWILGPIHAARKRAI